MKEEIKETTIETTEEIKPSSIFPYTKTLRFAVIRKLAKKERFHCNFAYLHDSKEKAEAEAIRLANKYGCQFYVVEIQSITSNKD